MNTKLIEQIKETEFSLLELKELREIIDYKTETWGTESGKTYPIM